ncbi:nuclear body protein SP140-like protein isoform 8-T8 [Molossus nigricans]
MATGGSDPSTRMSTENKRICDIALNLFKKYKVEISDAINTTFPFLEYLRDHGFITSEMYKHSHQSLTKRHGVQEVIYDVLTELEKTFDLSILEALFSKVIMKKYPDLYNIYKIFKTAIPDLELSPECEMERRPDVQLSLEQGTVKKPLSSLTWLYQDPSDYNGTAPPENELAEPLRETQLKHENETLPTTSALKTQQANEQFFQESKPAVLSSDEDELTEASTGEQRSNPVISSDEDEPAKASTGEQRMNPGTVDLGNSFTLAKIKRKRTIPDLELSPECEMEQRPDVQLSLEQGTVKKLLPSLTWLYQDPSDYNGIAPPENEFAELLHETQLINGNETISTTSDDKSVLETQQANEQCAQESEPAVISSDEDEPAKASTGEQRRNPGRNLEGASGACSSAGRSLEGHSGACSSAGRSLEGASGACSSAGRSLEGHSGACSSAGRRLEGASGACSSAGRRLEGHSGACSSAGRSLEGASGACSSAGRRLEGHSGACSSAGSLKGASRFCAEVKHPGAFSCTPKSDPNEKGTMDLGNNSTLGKAKKKIRKRKHEEENVDFSSDILPVTCGDIKGILYMKRLEQGTTMKCIKTQDGNWFNPIEFQVTAGYQRSGDWKRKVYCGGKTLRNLIKKGILPTLPRVYGRRRECENSELCDICLYGANLFRCDTCLRYFHEDCHIPPVETERSPWSCTFCRMSETSGSRQCLREPEVLERQMGPEEQLKCEFLLLKTYSERGIEMMPHNSRCMNDLRKLKEIKTKLCERGYPKVGGFMQAVHHVFQDHQASRRCNDFCLGIILEKKFEQNFKNVFAVQ